MRRGLLPTYAPQPVHVAGSRWTVLGRGRRPSLVICKCRCGRVKEIQPSHVFSGRSLSCGCRRGLSQRERDRIALLYRQGVSFSGITKETGRSAATITRVLRASAVLSRPRCGVRQYQLDESAFERDTPESRYWIGFILADGCVSLGQRKGQITITLCAADAAHIASFCRFVASDCPVRTRRFASNYGDSEAATITINSKAIARSLIARGIPPRKTKCAVPPTYLANDIDFWRGVVDGDGWLSYGRDRHGGWYVNLGVCGTKAVCEGFASFAARLVGGPTRGDRYGVLPIKSIWRTKVAGLQAIRLVERLYPDGRVSLPRKRLVADALAALASNL